MDQNNILDNLKANTGRDSALETLMDIERVLDTANIYTYKNWIEGEIVEGPRIDRYWVTITLMYPNKLMPDPEGALRLINNGCKVYFAEDVLITAAKLKTPDDSEGQDGAEGKRPGQTRAKKVSKPVWLVTLVMPRKYLDDVESSKLRVDDQDINSGSVQQAYTDEISDDSALGLE
mgnify:CR=1 FL=1|jgi:hypothetical protein